LVPRYLGLAEGQRDQAVLGLASQAEKLGVIQGQWGNFGARD
jgi:hypothetical protein